VVGILVRRQLFPALKNRDLPKCWPPFWEIKLVDVANSKFGVDFFTEKKTGSAFWCHKKRTPAVKSSLWTLDPKTYEK